MTTDELLKVARKDRITTITLNRPAARNALTGAMLRQLDDVLYDCEKDPVTRVVIITGGVHFCAGADLRELGNMTPYEAKEFSRLGQAVFRRIEALSKVVIAAVAGNALGGGCELALACDIRLAAETARFGLPEVNLGLIPGFGGTQRLSNLVGPGLAKELILTGRLIDAREASGIGLVSEVVSDLDLQERAEKLAVQLAGKSPVALRTAKKLLLDTSRVDQGLAMEVEAFSKCFDSQDRREGISAFLEKRPAVF
jgi:enoyl-CoA hydratase